MRIGFISDTHGRHGDLGNEWRKGAWGDTPWDRLSSCDAVVHCGDCTPDGRGYHARDFLSWFSRSFEGRPLLLVPGNHDFCFDPAWTAGTEDGRGRHARRVATEPVSRLMAEFPTVTLLQDSGAEACGLRFWGSGVTPWFHDWALNRRRGPEIRRHWDLVPEGTDVLVTHGPPKGVLDLLLPRYRRTGEDDNCGCADLLECVRRVDPRVHAFGHVHEGYGMRENVEGMGRTVFVNASSLDADYEPTHEPVIIDI